MAFAQFQDDFSDGDFSSNPVWLGEKDKFTVNTAKALQLNASAAGTAALYTAFQLQDSTVWEISVTMEFAPSATNFCRIYLQSERDSLTKSKAYFLELGENGSNDAIKLYKQSPDGSKSLLATAKAGAIANEPVKAHIKIIKNAVGKWQIWADYKDKSNFQLEAEAVDATFGKQEANFFGLFCTFTATRKDKMFFDDIKVSSFVVNTPPPPPPSASVQPYDIIINEFMADPSPSVGLAEQEYIELYNRSEKAINLNRFKINDNTAIGTVLPDFTLLPKHFVLLYQRKAGVSFPTADTLALDKLISLNNDGDKIILSDANGLVIDALAYDLDWYKDAKKSQGGWSLERINKDFLCIGTENWVASKSSIGGTPSSENTVIQENVENIPLEILKIVTNSDKSVLITFNKSLDRQKVLENGIFQVSNGLKISNVQVAAPFFNTVELFFEQNLQKGIEYELIISKILTDCENTALLKNLTQKFRLTELPAENDILINEILFNPASGGSDFVEFYNNSDKAINLKGLWIANVQKGSAKEILVDYVLLPKELVVVSDNPSNISSKFNVKNSKALVKNDLPAFNDDAGNVTIFLPTSNQDIILDALNYDEKWHFNLLDDKESVSLERIETNKPTQSSNNWHSAASIVGFATPTYINSQTLVEQQKTISSIFLTKTTFSPSSDEFNQLEIQYFLNSNGYLATVQVFDTQGQLIRKLLENQTLAVEGSFFWDGKDDNGNLAPMGIYLIAVNVFKLSGEKLHFKRNCVLIHPK